MTTRARWIDPADVIDEPCAAVQGQTVYTFGPYRLARCARQLCQGAAPVRLGGRALDLLFVLVERAGDVVSRAELERLIWPDSIVEDSCLRVHIGALRRALGDSASEARYIANVPGRGYSFVAPVTVLGGAAPATATPGLPPCPARLIGRAEALQALRAQLPHCRLVTVVGHGGIGKTALALTLAHALRDDYDDGACFLDLAALTDGARAAPALAAALGLAPGAGDGMALLARWLATRRMLLVFDNCEHVIEAATVLVEHLLRAAPGIDILATSREPLDADGEWVHRLAPLACPPDTPGLGLADALTCPALQLLVERTGDSTDRFELTAADLPAALRLCRRLDGVPLALEFAAVRVALLGMHGVLAQMDDGLRLLGSGRRTVLPRHRTLRALLDWSYDLLTPDERHVLRCCAVFSGPFTLDGALAVAGRGRDVTGAVLALVAKSLLTADTGGAEACFALLGITRAYAAGKLVDDPGRAGVSARHARHVLALLRGVEAAGELPAWPGDLAGELRVALDWAFGSGDARALGVELAAAPAVRVAGLLGAPEMHRYAALALDAVAGGAAAHPFDVLRLHALRALTGAPGNVDASGRMLAQTGAHAEALVEALYHCATCCQAAGDEHAAQAHAARMARVAGRAGHRPGWMLARRLCAHSLHMLGEHAPALALLHQLPHERSGALPMRLDSPLGHATCLDIVAARAHWMTGRGLLALTLANDCVERAATARSPLALAHALALGALPVALWQGDAAWAEALAGRLAAHAERHGLVEWATWARLYRHVLAARAGQPADLARVAASCDARQGDHLATFGVPLALPATRARCEAGLVRWCAPEVLRAAGDAARLAGDDARAHAGFTRALTLARHQGALGWELRCALGLARLAHAGGDQARVGALLEPLVDALGESHGGADLAAAHRLLA